MPKRFGGCHATDQPGDEAFPDAIASSVATVVVLGAAVLLGASLVAAAAGLAWWATGGGLWGVAAALLLTPLTLLLAQQVWDFAFLVLWGGASIRQAKRRLQSAEQEGRTLAARRARLEIALLRRRRRQ